MNNKKKLFIIVGILFLSILLIAGSTFAYLQWATSNEQRTNVSFSQQSKGFSCSATGGGNITESEVKLAPSLCTNSQAAIKRTITTNVVNNRNEPIYMDLWLDIKNITQGLSDSVNFRYALTTSGEGCNAGDVLSSGNFIGKSINDKVNILNNSKYPVSGSNTYYLYIWLDAEEEEDFTQDQAFHLELGGECGDNQERPNAPKIVDGLIPVKLSPSGDTVTTVATTDSEWYDYDNKKWANAVLVKEDGTLDCENGHTCHTRDYYHNNVGVTMEQNDILAYYVWIPRYSYRVWAYSGNDPAGDPHEIPIKFVDANTIETATQNGEWYTHPAFWWDDNSDGVRDQGEELDGIWVGKFETGNIKFPTNSDCSSSNCTEYNGIRILPNVRPLTRNKFSRLFFLSRAMETSGNAYGINPDTTDTHLMKNSEWGAVAYLSHSKYGINTEIRVNSFIGGNGSAIFTYYQTGCGSDTLDKIFNGEVCYFQYGNFSVYPQSTTGNVTGLFDMAGGAIEFVMGTYYNNYNSTLSGFSSTNPLPATKYYDDYPNPPFDGTSSYNNFTRCTLAMCGGHALNETKGWYGDSFSWVSDSNWFAHGGYYSSGWKPGGLFNVLGRDGQASEMVASRFVLLADDE